MNEPANEAECICAAAAAAELSGETPASAGLMRRGPVKDTFLVELDGGFAVLAAYRQQDRAQAAARACRDAFASKLGPEPLGAPANEVSIGSRSWTGYRFVPGPTLEQRADLVSSYSTLGGFAARWHQAQPRNCLSSALGRFDHPIVPPAVRERTHMLAGGSGPDVSLHGDLNASNIIDILPEIAIDFDETCRGPAAIDLALALAYVNTSPADVTACLRAILSGYRREGQAIDAQLLLAWLRLMPWYMTAAEHQRIGRSAFLPGAEAVIAAHNSFIDRVLST